MKHCHKKHNLISFLYCKFLELVDAFFDLFGDADCTCEKSQKQTGEIMVTGQDEIDILLDSNPTHVKVNFTDDCYTAPCNPGQDDELTWDVVVSNCGSNFSLHIEWNVAGARDITWKVCY